MIPPPPLYAGPSGLRPAAGVRRATSIATALRGRDGLRGQGRDALATGGEISVVILVFVQHTDDVKRL